MTLTLLLFHSPFRFWAGIATLSIIGLSYLVDALTGGYTLGYLKCKISQEAKASIISFQLILSLLIAIVLPNHVLNEISFIQYYYDKKEFYIGLSSLVLFLFFVMISGLIITRQARKHGIEEKVKTKPVRK